MVKQVAEAEKYDAILQEAIYINPKHDITEKVIKALNASDFCRRQVAPRIGVALRLGAIVEALGGELQGDPALSIERLAPLATAQPDALSFLSHPKYRKELARLAGRLRHRVAGHARGWRPQRGAFIVAPDPYLYFARLTQLWKKSHARPEAARIHPSAVIDPDAHDRSERPHRRAVRGRARRAHRRRHRAEVQA